MLRVLVETLFEVQRINFLLQVQGQAASGFFRGKNDSAKNFAQKTHGKCQKRSGPKLKKKIKMKKTRVTSFFRIEKRGLNLMRSMQQGISTHYNTRFGI